MIFVCSSGRSKTISALIEELEARYHQLRPTSDFNLGRFRLWYAFVRALRPNVIVETGVHDGLSSSVLLYALNRNDSGQLISIDLPSTDLPGAASGPGWLVPDRFKESWTLLLGDAKRLLPDTVKRTSSIDLFIHDSDHSEEHRKFEFSTVWPSLSPGALVLSDQDYPDETVVSDFAKYVGGRHARVQTVRPQGRSPRGVYTGGVRLGL